MVESEAGQGAVFGVTLTAWGRGTPSLPTSPCCAYTLDLLAAHMGLHIEHALLELFKIFGVHRLFPG